MDNQHAGLGQQLAAQRITPTAWAGHPRTTGPWRSPAASPAPVADGPWLVAAGPLARRRH